MAMGRAATVCETILAFVVDRFFVDNFADDEFFLRAGIIESMEMLQLVGCAEEVWNRDPGRGAHP